MPSKGSINAAVAVAVCYLLAGVVEASAMRPSANDNQQLRQLCNQTTSTRLASGNRRVNPVAADRCYAQAMDKLQPSVYVDGGEVYLKYKRTGRIRATQTITCHSTISKVGGVYVNTSKVIRHPKEVQHLRRIVIGD